MRLGWWIAAAAIALLSGLQLRRVDPEAAGAAPEPSATRESAGAGEAPPAAAPSPPAKDPAVPELRRQLEVANQKLEILQEERRWLEEELARAESDRERYRSGLEAAVAELERLGEELERLRRQAGAGRVPSLPPPPEDRVRPLGAPHVTVSPMGFVVASGLVDNPYDYSTRGSLEISLVGSAGVIEAREILMHIGPRSTERYDLTFTNIFPTERLVARARWVE